MKCIRCSNKMGIRKSQRTGRIIIYCDECIKETGIILVEDEEEIKPTQPHKRRIKT